MSMQCIPGKENEICTSWFHTEILYITPNKCILHVARMCIAAPFPICIIYFSINPIFSCCREYLKVSKRYFIWREMFFFLVSKYTFWFLMHSKLAKDASQRFLVRNISAADTLLLPLTISDTIAICIAMRPH